MNCKWRRTAGGGVKAEDEDATEAQLAAEARATDAEATGRAAAAAAEARTAKAEGDVDVLVARLRNMYANIDGSSELFTAVYSSFLQLGYLGGAAPRGWLRMRDTRC